MLMFSWIVLKIITKGETLYSTGIYKSSQEYGIAGDPNSNGYIVFPGGDSIPVRLNKNGERISTDLRDDDDCTNKDKILFIGDSFTFGDANYYEETYPYLIAKKSDMHLTNASMVGYGYAQYLIKIQEVLSKEHFDFIAIQLSPHSVERAVNGFLPAFSKIPTPFLCVDMQDNIIIHPARYKTNVFEVVNAADFTQFSDKTFTVSLFFRFFSKVGLPLYLYQIKNDISVALKKKTYKRVLTSDEAEQYFFASLNQLLASEKKEFVFFNVGYEPDYFDKKAEKLKNELKFRATFVNMERPLWNQVNNLDEYQRQFCHWRGNPPILVDQHYNKKANAIVADEFIKEVLSKN